MLGQLGRSVPDDEREVPGGDRGRVRGFPGRGYVYKGLKPVHWCIKDRTALAEAEVEYEDHTSPSIWVRFALTSDPAEIHPDLAGRNVYGRDLDHDAVDDAGQHGDRLSTRSSSTSAVEVAGDVYIVAADLVKVTAEKCGWSDYRDDRDIPGREARRRGVPAIRSWSAIRWAFWPTT